MVGTDVHTIVELLPRLGADVGCVNDEIEVEFFPNRPDLFSVEGAARALRGMLGIETGLPTYTARPSGIEVEVDKSVNLVRPYICLLYTSPSPRDGLLSRMPSSA